MFIIKLKGGFMRNLIISIIVVFGLFSAYILLAINNNKASITQDTMLEKPIPTTQLAPQPNQAQQVKEYADTHMNTSLEVLICAVVNTLKIEFKDVPQIKDEWRSDDGLYGYTTYKMSFPDESKLEVTTQDSKLCSADYYGEDGKQK